MAPSGEGTGAVPTLGAEDLLAAVPSLREVAEVRATNLRRVPGASLTENDILEALHWATAEIDNGATGVVLVQGTDTLEETSYLLDLWWDRPEPLVLTGAMRTPNSLSPDGPANLFTSVSVAASSEARDYGVVVAMNSQLHSAARVRKAHATALEAFISPDTGPIGVFQENQLLMRPTEPGKLRSATPLALPNRNARVALVETHLGDDGRLLNSLGKDEYDGIVVAAYGVGHVAEVVADVLETLVPRLPVVVATRTGGGSTLKDTYGFKGSESDLLDRGVLLAGWLDPRKTRLLTWAALSNGSSRSQLARELTNRGRLPA
jgi:L-asparaginase